MLGREASVGEVTFNPFSLALTVRAFELKDPDSEIFASFDELFLNVSMTSPFRWAAVVDELRISGPRVRVRLLEEGRLSFADLLEKLRDEVGDDKGPRRVDLELLELSKGAFEFVDMTRSPPYDLEFDDLNLELRHLSTIDRDQGAHEVALHFDEETVLRWSGTLQANPLVLNGRFELDGLNVASVWDYVGEGQPFDLPEGRINAAAAYQVERTGPGEFHAELSDGSGALTGLTLVDRLSSMTCLTLESAKFESVRASWPEQKVEVGSVLVKGPSVEVLIEDGGALNWRRYIPAGDALAEVGDEGAPPVTLSVASVELRDGAARLSDTREEPPAKAVVTAADGRMTGFAWPETDPARVELVATVGERGSVRMDGAVSLATSSAVLDASVSDISIVEHQAWLEVPFGTLVSGTARAEGARAIARAGDSTVGL